MHANSIMGLIAGACLMMGQATSAAWPTDPDEPLVLGETLGFGPDHQIVTTPDGAIWIAWIDHQCFASLRVQRISSAGQLHAAGGQILETRDDCDSLDPRIVAQADNTVAVSAVNLPGTAQPVYRLDADGLLLWAPDVIADQALADNVEQLMAFANGDTLVAGSGAAGSFVLGRYDANGEAVWDPQTVSVPNATGSNLRMFALVPDGDNGAYILWDAPGTYTRVVLANRIDAAGAAAWASPLVLVAIPPGSSRHTDPIALPDGLGGLLLIWTQGAEQSTTPVPIRMQRLDASGNMLLAADGERVSTSDARQFDVRVTRHPQSDDVFVVWRDGPLNAQSIRAQRMSMSGERLWSDTGVEIATVNDADSQYSIARLTTARWASQSATRPTTRRRPA